MHFATKSGSSFFASRLKTTDRWRTPETDKNQQTENSVQQGTNQVYRRTHQQIQSLLLPYLQYSTMGQNVKHVAQKQQSNVAKKQRN